jgi:ABC-type transport system substrate-binding protein
MVLSGEADAIEVLVTPANIAKAEADSALTLYPYPGPTFTFLRFNLRANGDRSKPNPVLADQQVRRALVLAANRPEMIQAVFAGHAKMPPGPMPQLWSWLWKTSLTPTPPDTVEARRLLRGRRVSFHIAVPATSPTRVQYAQLLQEEYRHLGVEVVIDQVDNATLQQLLESGKFDATMESYQTDPSPSNSVRALWGRGGPTNYGRYANDRFEALIRTAANAPSREAAQAAWEAAFAELAQDPPAVILYALDNVAAVNRRVSDVRIQPDSWWGLVRTWRILPKQLTERDRAGR